MNGKKVVTVLTEGLKLRPRVQDHAKGCDLCQQLVRSLDSPVPVDPPSPATLRQIADAIATDFRPVRPVAPARFLGAFVGIFVSIVALSVYRLGAFAIPVMSPLQTAALLSTLAISSCLLASSLVQQMLPGSRHIVTPSLLPVGVTISLAVAIVIFVQFQQEQHFWTNAWACIRAGTPIGALAAVLFWLVLRRGAVLSPSMTGAATGLLAGLVGTTVLEIHCPILNAWHILASHLGVAVLCALAGLLAGLTVEVAGGRSVHRNHQEL